MTTTKDHFNIIIIGAGPIGIECAIALEQQGADYLLLEEKQIGDAFMKWPPNTQFFSTPEHVALAGVPVQNVNQQPITGDQYLAYLRMLIEYFDLNLRNYEPVLDIVKEENGRFQLTTQRRTAKHHYTANHVIVATGGMAGPRKLNIPGETLPHVTHYFPGPHTYFKTKVLIVGGRNSAAEAALRCWRVGATEVALSYRKPGFEFERMKPHLSMDLLDRIKKEEIKFYPGTIPIEITPTHVILASSEDGLTPNGSTIKHETDFVLLATGFEADLSLVERAGVLLVGDAMSAKHNPETMETNVAGLYVIGTAVGGTQSRFKLFISTTHDHVGKVVTAITGHAPKQLGTVGSRNNAVTWQEVQAN